MDHAYKMDHAYMQLSEETYSVISAHSCWSMEITEPHIKSV